MRTNFSGLGAKLEGRLVHALYLARRWGVQSFTCTLDTAVGFQAELLFDDAPAWRMHAEEFSYLEDAVLQQLVEYAYVHRIAPEADRVGGPRLTRWMLLGAVGCMALGAVLTIVLRALGSSAS